MVSYSRIDIEQSLEILRAGGVILYPTDTIWGLGCDATNQDAVNKIYQIKERTDSKSMLVLVDNESRIYSYVREVPEIAGELIGVADKPLTVIYPGARNLATNLLAEDGSIGIRVVKDKFCQELINRFKKPLVSTSANISGSESPSSFKDINPDIISRVDYVVNWRQEEIQKRTASSIIKLGQGGEFKIIRP